MFLCVQLSANFLKIAFFKKRVQELVFPKFSVLSLTLDGKFSGLGLLKHYKNRVFSQFVCLFLLKKKRIGQKKDNWNFRFFVQKWLFRDAHLFFKKMLC